MKYLPNNDLLNKLAAIVMPSEYLNDFDVSNITDEKEKWLVELREKEDRIPSELAGKDVVLDGFCTPVDVMTHAFSLKRIYLRF